MASLHMLILGLLGAVYCQPPQQPAPIQYMILEELPPATMIGNVATDAKLIDKYPLRVLRQLRFRFLVQPEKEDLELFSIEETSGIIETTQRIDRDTMCPEKPACYVSLDVAVGPAQYFQVISVKIDILDKNDNTPEFPEPLLLKSMSEATLPGMTVSIPPASDPDSPKYSIKSYQLLSDSDAFQLVETPTYEGGVDLRLKLICALDREAQDLYQMKVLAIDGGKPPGTGTVVVNITITDMNDNSPVFTNNTYQMFVKEDVNVNTTLVTLHANDADIGQNSRIIYSFTFRTINNHGDTFAINPKSGAITLKSPLDFDKSAVYHLAVRAQDRGPDSQPSNYTIIINVLEVNDNLQGITINNLTSSENAETSEASVSAFSDEVRDICDSYVSCQPRQWRKKVNYLVCIQWSCVLVTTIVSENVQNHLYCGRRQRDDVGIESSRATCCKTCHNTPRCNSLHQLIA